MGVFHPSESQNRHLDTRGWALTPWVAVAPGHFAVVQVEYAKPTLGPPVAVRAPALAFEPLSLLFVLLLVGHLAVRSLWVDALLLGHTARLLVLALTLEPPTRADG